MFDTLAYLIGVLADKKFHNFRPVLEMYIQRHFSGAMVHRSLCQCLRSYVDNATDDNPQKLRMSFKALEYMFKLIVQSRMLYNRGKRGDDFKPELLALFQSFYKFMRNPGESIHMRASQQILLQHFASVFADLNKIFTMAELGHIAGEFLRSIPSIPKLAAHKLKFVHSLVKDILFASKESRMQVFPAVTDILREHIERREDLEPVLDILQDLLNVLSTDQTPAPAPNAPNQYDDLLQVRNLFSVFLFSGCIITVYCTVLSSSAVRVPDMQLVATLLMPLVALAQHFKTSQTPNPEAEMCILAILRQMSEWHYRTYISSLSQPDKLIFLRSMFAYFQTLVARCSLPPDWYVMRMLQSEVILTAVQQLTSVLADNFLGPNFDAGLWRSFFLLSVAYLRQDDLQLHRFSDTKREKIVQKHGDRRTMMAVVTSEMWSNLGAHQRQFIPDLVGPFQEMALVPEPELRRVCRFCIVHSFIISFVSICRHLFPPMYALPFLCFSLFLCPDSSSSHAADVAHFLHHDGARRQHVRQLCARRGGSDREAGQRRDARPGRPGVPHTLRKLADRGLPEKPRGARPGPRSCHGQVDFESHHSAAVPAQRARG